MFCKWCGMESETTDHCSWCRRAFTTTSPTQTATQSDAPPAGADAQRSTPVALTHETPSTAPVASSDTGSLEAPRTPWSQTPPNDPAPAASTPTAPPPVEPHPGAPGSRPIIG